MKPFIPQPRGTASIIWAGVLCPLMLESWARALRPHYLPLNNASLLRSQKVQPTGRGHSSVPARRRRRKRLPEHTSAHCRHEPSCTRGCSRRNNFRRSTKIFEIRSLRAGLLSSISDIPPILSPAGRSRNLSGSPHTTAKSIRSAATGDGFAPGKRDYSKSLVLRITCICLKSVSAIQRASTMRSRF